MKSRLVCLLSFIVLTCLSWPPPLEAVYDPREVPNNRFGIHVADTNEMAEVVDLVNSSGGDWGYITLVVQENDRDEEKWQEVFGQLAKFHLIPIVRLATRPAGSFWKRPETRKLDSWVEFLSGLDWPIRNRYLVLFNEPNHAKEWGGRLDPEGYAEVLVWLARKFKKASDRFFILPAGLDASAVSDGSTMDEAEFLRRMVAADPEVLNLIDGWTSHSYPNPGFSGLPSATGRGTVRTFEWELSYLRRLGLKKDLPVFITETGWLHDQGVVNDPKLLSSDEVAGRLRAVALSVWNDPRVVAVTPFIFNYQAYPFDHFSWKVLGADTYYAPYYTYRELVKEKGAPRRDKRESWEERKEQGEPGGKKSADSKVIPHHHFPVALAAKVSSWLRGLMAAIPDIA